MYKEKAASKSKTESLPVVAEATGTTVLAGTYLLRYGTTMYRGTMVP